MKVGLHFNVFFLKLIPTFTGIGKQSDLGFLSEHSYGVQIQESISKLVIYAAV